MQPLFPMSNTSYTTIASRRSSVDSTSSTESGGGWNCGWKLGAVSSPMTPTKPPPPTQGAGEPTHPEMKHSPSFRCRSSVTSMPTSPHTLRGSVSFRVVLGADVDHTASPPGTPDNSEMRFRRYNSESAVVDGELAPSGKDNAHTLPISQCDFTPSQPRRLSILATLGDSSPQPSRVETTTTPPPCPPTPSTAPTDPAALAQNLADLPTFLSSRREVMLREVDHTVSVWEATLPQIDHNALVSTIQAAADLRRTQLLVAAEQDLVRQTDAMWDNIKALQGPVGLGAFDIVEICRANCLRMAEESMKLTNSTIAEKRQAFIAAFQTDLADFSKSQMKEVAVGFSNMSCLLAANCTASEDLCQTLETQVRTILRPQAHKNWAKFENQTTRLLDYIHLSEGTLPPTVLDLSSSEATLSTLKFRTLRDATEQHHDDVFSRTSEDLELVVSTVTCLSLAQRRRGSVTSVGSASSTSSLGKPPLSPLVKSRRELSQKKPARISGPTAIRAPTVSLLRNM